MTVRCVVGGRVAGIGIDRDRCWEAHLLPTGQGAGVLRDAGEGQLRAIVVVERYGIALRILMAAIVTDPSDRAGTGRGEFDAERDCASIGVKRGIRHGIAKNTVRLSYRTPSIDHYCNCNKDYARQYPQFPDQLIDLPQKNVRSQP